MTSPSAFPRDGQQELGPHFTSPEAVSPYTIGTATFGDLETVAVHMETVYADVYPNDRGITRDMFEGNPGFQREMRAYLEGQLTDPSKTLLLARDGDQVVGTIGIGASEKNPQAGKIWGFYVDPTLQGQGIGQQLWTELMDHADAAGFESLVLDVAKDAKVATDFYLKKGFMITGEEDWDWPSWTEERPHNQYWLMEKKLATEPPLPLLQRPKADAYFRPKAFESEQLYKRLGVTIFKKVVPTNGDLVLSLMRRFNPKATFIPPEYAGQPRRDRIKKFENVTRQLELVHVIGTGALGLVQVELEMFSTGPTGITIGLATQALGNIYPIMLQRYNRLRVYDALKPKDTTPQQER